MRISFFKSSKISHRLTLNFALLFFGALFLVNLVTLLSVNLFINNTAEQQLRLLAETINSEVTTIDAIPSIDLQQYSKIAENVDINFMVNGDSVYHTSESDSIALFDSSIHDAIQTAKSGEGRIINLNIEYTLEDGNILTVQLFKDMDNSDEYIKGITSVIFIIDIIMFFLSVAVGYYMSQKALKPIDQITEQAQKISATDLSTRIKTDGPNDELKRLANTFNDFISRIEEVYKRQNRFTIDASHELATPIAVIKGYIDMLDRWGSTNEEVLDESITSIKVELDNITRLLDTLLYLSKGDNQVYVLKTQDINISTLINELIQEMSFVDTKHKIIKEGSEHLMFKLDVSLIKQMLRALLNNSIKYSAEKTEIKIKYSLHNHSLELEICDQGVGIPHQDIPFIFDRFYRVDKARNRELGGTGLGLSIVKWIVDIHHGKIEVESEENKGSCFRISLPIIE